MATVLAHDTTRHTTSQHATDCFHSGSAVSASTLKEHTNRLVGECIIDYRARQKPLKVVRPISDATHQLLCQQIAVKDVMLETNIARWCASRSQERICWHPFEDLPCDLVGLLQFLNEKLGDGGDVVYMEIAALSPPHFVRKANQEFQVVFNPEERLAFLPKKFPMFTIDKAIYQLREDIAGR